MKESVCVFGSFAVDLIARTPHLPAKGETVKGSAFQQSAGGKGFNQGIAAHKAGADVAMITKLGHDTFANVALDMMDEVGMPKDHLFFSDQAATGTSLIMVDESTSQNEIVIIPGACSTFSAYDISAVSDLIKNSGYLLLQLEINQDANEQVAALAKENGVKVIINTAPYQPVSDEFLRGAYLVTPNEVEAEEMTGVAVKDLESADRAAKVFLDKGVKNVLITLGGKGVYIHSEGESKIIPAYRVNAIDTTGAGDAFNGGLLAALAEGKTLEDAALFANALAAISVQRKGAAPSMPDRNDIEQFLAAHGAAK